MEHGDEREAGAMRAYVTPEITVEWRAERCQHSGNCVRALPRVFNPRRRPWVDVSAAGADAIAQAVMRCPSGALQFVRHNSEAQADGDAPADGNGRPE